MEADLRVTRASEARAVQLATEERLVLVAPAQPRVRVATEARQEQVAWAAQEGLQEPQELEASVARQVRQAARQVRQAAQQVRQAAQQEIPDHV
jgi:hypothetical protein